MSNELYANDTDYSNVKIIRISQEQKRGMPKMDRTLPETEDVILHNLIGRKRALKLNSVKLIENVIMQVVKDKEELNQSYIISIKELPELLGVSADNVYQEVEEITDDIIKNPLYVKKENVGKSIR